MSKPADPPDYYRVLDLKPGATLADVEKAYRDLSKVWQPDRFGNDRPMRQKAKDKLRQIKQAYERLRQELDKDDEEDTHNAPAAPTTSTAPAPTPAPQPSAGFSQFAAKWANWDPCWLLAVLAVVLALTFLGIDSYVRIKGIQTISQPFTTNEPAPARDAKSLTGFYGNQHEQVMPALGTDGYHWIMQTELMLHGDAGIRVRHVDYDGPPGGRDVHWSSSLHWVVTGLAWFDHLINGIPMVDALQREMSWANTFVLLMCMLLVPLFTARRFGWAPTAMVALGFVVVYPYYEFSFVGYFDHHGLVATCDLMMVLFLAGAGGGWLRNDDAKADRLSTLELDVWSWLPDKKQSRRWALASAIAGGTGLWISTASVVPGMFGIGVGAVVGTGLLAIGLKGKSPWRADPTLWRYWGVAGAITSLFYYLLEYFPHYISVFSAVVIFLIGAILLAMFGKGPLRTAGLGLTGLFTLLALGLLIFVPTMRVFRLEVNHPLYALAWLGAGDLICRVCQLCQRDEDAPPRGEGFWLNWWAGAAGNLLMLSAIPLSVMILGEKVFVIRPGEFLMILHEDYILEFRTFVKQVSFLSAVQVISGISIAPLVSLPMFVLLFMSEVKRPMKAVLLVAFLPATLMLVLAFLQVRWLGIDCAVSIAALATTLLVMTHIWPELPLGKITVIMGGTLALAMLMFIFWYDAAYADYKFVLAALIDLALFAAMIFLRRQWYEIAAVLGLVIAFFLLSFCNNWMGFINSVGTASLAGLVLMLVIVWLKPASRKVMYVLVVTLAWAFTAACCSFIYPSVQKFLTDNVFLTQMQMLTPNKPLAIFYAFFIVGKVVLLLSTPAFLVGLFGLLFLRWKGAETVQAVFVGLFLFFMLMVTSVYPLTNTFQWSIFRFVQPPNNLDITQLATRDVSHRLRLRLGDQQGIILSGPTTTTWMMYFGGFRGVGDLYWENVEGLRATAKVYGAEDNNDDFKSAYDQIKQLGITHIAIFSWDPFAVEYARLGSTPPIHLDPENPENYPKDAFIVQLFFNHRIPLWLRPLPYTLPNHPDLQGHAVNIFEVVPPQKPEDWVLHIAEWIMASGSPNSMKQAEVDISEGLIKYKPNYLPLLVDLALVQQTLGENDAFKATMAIIASHLDQVSNLTLESRLDLAMDYYQLNLLNNASDLTLCAQQIEGCIAMANDNSVAPDDNSLRHLPVERMQNFLQLIVDVYRDRPLPKVYDELMAYISPGMQAQILHERASMAESLGHYAQAVDFERQALKLQPEYDTALRALASILSISPDASVRNGKEAVELVDKLNEIVKGQGWDTIDLMACAYAEDQKFDDAIFYESQAIQLLNNTNQTAKAAELGKRLSLFLAHQPYHKS